MDYERHYYKLIVKRKIEQVEGYSEKHHIIPRSWGGSDSHENIVKLTAREHLVAHLMLFKIAKGKKKAAMAAAILFMGNGTSRAYEQVRKHQAKVMSLRAKKLMRENNPFIGKPSNIAGRKWITNGQENKCILASHELPDGWRYGRVFILSDEGRTKKAKAITLYNKTRENPLKGKKWSMSDASKVKMQEVAKKREEKRKQSGKLHHTQILCKAKGKVWVNKDGMTKMVLPNEVNQMILAGWIVGRKPRK